MLYGHCDVTLHCMAETPEHRQVPQTYVITYFTSLTGLNGWLHGTVVERRSVTGEISLSCARPAADGRLLICVNRPLQVSQLGLLRLSSFLGR